MEALIYDFYGRLFVITCLVVIALSIISIIQVVRDRKDGD